MVNKIFISIFILFASCSSIIPSKKVTIGIDPNFFSSPIGNKQALVYPFTVELISEIFKPTKFNILFQELAFDNLVDNLNESKSDLIVSSLPIRYETLNLYNFSNILLPLGDIFVSRKKESLDFAFYGGKIIAIENKAEIVSLFANYTDITLTYYSYIPEVLEMIINYTVDGAVIPALLLFSHLSEEHRRLLNTGTTQLTSTGLKLTSLKNKNSGIINIFNKRLAVLKNDGTYQKLLNKWNLSF
jgi:ABC-type amino acid transport substrate-binding protein